MGSYTQNTPVGPGYTSLTRPPATSFITTQVPAPTELYVSGDSKLRITVGTWLTAGGSFILSFKLLLSDTGQVTTQQEPITVPTASFGPVVDIPLQEGFLLGVSITAVGLPEQRGQMFAVGSVIRGSGLDIKVDRILFADYIVGNQAIGFPSSQVNQSVDGRGAKFTQSSGPFGAGNEVLVAPQSEQRLQLQALVLTFVASATVANRTPELRIVNSGVVLYRAPFPGNITAGQTVQLVYLVAGPQPALNNGVAQMPLPEPCIIEGLDTIVTVTGGLQVGDQYTLANLTAEAWVIG